MKTMSNRSGWRIAYWTNAEAAGWPWLVERALTEAFLRADVQGIPDRDVDSLSITAPKGTDPDLTARAAELASYAAQRVR